MAFSRLLSGVSQGSVLASLLFLVNGALCVGDIPTRLKIYQNICRRQKIMQKESA